MNFVLQNGQLWPLQMAFGRVLSVYGIEDSRVKWHTSPSLYSFTRPGCRVHLHPFYPFIYGSEAFAMPDPMDIPLRKSFLQACTFSHCKWFFDSSYLFMTSEIVAWKGILHPVAFFICGAPVFQPACIIKNIVLIIPDFSRPKYLNGYFVFVFIVHIPSE